MNLLIKLLIYLSDSSPHAHIFLVLVGSCSPSCMSHSISDHPDFSFFTQEDIRGFALWDGVALHFLAVFTMMDLRDLFIYCAPHSECVFRDAL